MCFVDNDKHISDKKTYNKGGIGWCEMDCAKEYLVEWSKYYQSDKNSFIKTRVGLSEVLLYKRHY